MRIYMTVAAVALLGSWTMAAAQEPLQAGQPQVSNCLCVGDASSRVATVEDVGGLVLLGNDTGYTPIQSRAELSVGDRIILLRHGQAVLSAGPTCRIALSPGSVISVIDSEGRACITQAATVVPTQAPPDEDENLTFNQDALLLLGAAGVGVGIVAFVALGDDDDGPVSP